MAFSTSQNRLLELTLTEIRPPYVFMQISRITIRDFLDKVEWATAGNVCYFLTGRNEKKEMDIVKAELWKMTRTKINPLKRPANSLYAVFSYVRDYVGMFKIAHDVKLRNCLGKFFSDNPDLLGELSLEPPADARTKDLYFEMDNGHMDDAQLADKIRTHYSGHGAFRVVFFMATKEFQHWKTKQHLKQLELKRLYMLFEIIKRVLPEKPNRILGASYTQYLEDGKIYNYKGREVL